MGILAFLHRIAARDGGKKMRLLLNESVPEHGHALHSGVVITVISHRGSRLGAVASSMTNHIF